jgi:hypothetical protein
MVDAGQWPERALLQALLELGRRPRGAALLRRTALAGDLVERLLAMERYEDDAVSVALGFDADAVALRGRELRRRESRP